MFDRLFGSYLVDSEKLTPWQLSQVYEIQDRTNTKLGVMAVNGRLLTVAQAEEINALQATKDARFGELAKDLGYMTDAQIDKLLSEQQEEFLTFTQAILDRGFLSLDAFSNALKEYQRDNEYTDEEMDLLKRDDIEQAIPLFLGKENEKYSELFLLAFKCIFRLIDRHVFPGKASIKTSVNAECIGYQKLFGSENGFAAVAGRYEDVRDIAIAYTNEEFIETREDALDAVCELINCINGVYCSKKSKGDVHIDINPPLYQVRYSVVTADRLIVLPIYLCGVSVDLILSMENGVVVK